MADLPNLANQESLSHYELLRNGCGWAVLEGFTLIRFEGPDAKDWLQGQITNDIRLLDEGGSLATCICLPTGHLVSVGVGWQLNGAVAMAVPTATLASVLERVERLVIMEDLSATLWSQRALTIQGPHATTVLEGLVGRSLSGIDAFGPQEGGFLLFRNDRSGSGGWDVWAVEGGEERLETVVRELRHIGDSALDLARLEAGIPRWGRDMGTGALAAELGPAFSARHISYTKGCYVGQEVLMRIYSRGHTNRTWVALIAEEPLQIGSPVVHHLKLDAGIVTSVATSPEFGPIAAAMLRNEAAREGEQVIVRCANREVLARVRAMPLLGSR